jgi:hypothetical protein
MDDGARAISLEGRIERGAKRNNHRKGRGFCVSTVSIVCIRPSGRPKWPPPA